jgi:elongation factor P
VRAKIRNVISGGVIERTFNPTDKFENAFVERREMEYLYNDEELYYFMDNESYEQIPVGKEIIATCRFELIKENTPCKVLSYKGSVFGLELPTFVELKVTETEPGVRGDTATNVQKAATLETGAVVKVPLFIESGEVLRVDTRTGEYMERARN